jgi:hypothetical protein
MALAWLVVAAGVLLATARVPALVVLAAMLGNVAVSTGETGPFLSIEQVLVARAAAGRDLTLRMSLYNLVGYVASGLGALTVAALPGGRQADGMGAAGLGGHALLFWLFAISGVVQALLYSRLPDIPVAPAAAGARRFPSRRLIHRIAALFALDSFAGGFVLRASSSTGSTLTSRSRRPRSAWSSSWPRSSRRARCCSRSASRSGSGS